MEERRIKAGLRRVIAILAENVYHDINTGFFFFKKKSEMPFCGMLCTHTFLAPKISFKTFLVTISQSKESL